MKKKTKNDRDNYLMDNRKKNDINSGNPKLLLFYKSNSKHLNLIYSTKLDWIITQNQLEKRGKFAKLNIKSPRHKDRISERISSKLSMPRNEKIDHIKDVNLFVWNAISKEIPKWTQVEILMNSYFNSIDLKPLYPSLELLKAFFSIDLQDILFKIVTLSKNVPELSRAASNAISILSKLGYSLNDKDLQYISIPYSDLSNTLIINTNFQNSNLNYVNFSQSTLHNINFKNCSLENAKFSYYPPFITYKQIGTYFDYSNCGKYLAAFGLENEKIIRIWDIASDILIKEINAGDLRLFHLLRFSPSRKYITTIKAGIATLFDQQNDYQITTFGGFHKYVSCFAFSSCETYIAAGSYDNSIRVWYLKSKELIHNLCGHAEEVIDLTFSPCNNYFYSVGNDSDILVWALQPKDIIVQCYKGKTFMGNKLKKGKKLIKRLKDENWIKSIKLANKGKFIISLSTKISMWNINLGEKIFCYSTSLHLYTTSFNLNNLIAIRADGGTILVFNIETQQFIYETYCEAGNASRQLAFLQNEKLIAAASEVKGFSFFDISDINYNKSIIRSNYVVNSISFSPCGKYFVIHRGEARIELWDLAAHKFIKCIEGNSPNTTGKFIMYSSYGTYIATPNNHSIFIYSSDLEYLNELSDSSRQISALAISCDETLIASGDIQNTIILWKVQDLKKSIIRVTSFNGVWNYIKYLGFSQDKEMLISCANNNKINIWSVQEMKCIRTFKLLKESNVILQVSPCHQLMAYASELSKKVFLYDLKSNAWEKESLICSASAPYKSLKFSPSGKYIAVLSIKNIETKPINEIYIWHVESKQLLSNFQESAGIINCLEFSHSENIIVVGIKNCIIKFWDWEKMIVIK